MQDSSVKKTSFHSATHILLPSHNWWRRRLWFCVKGRRSNGRLADRPLCCKQRRMVRADTEWCVTGSMCYAMVRDVTERSVTAMRTICLSSHEKMPFKWVQSTTLVRCTLLHPTVTYPLYTCLVSFNKTTEFPVR
ncbi:hypothetical protein TNCV_2731911 [Trichonephila clavipes]|nr:hypothetical protein TNCV_2731911 [Trichonephila clavipes]